METLRIVATLFVLQAAAAAVPVHSLHASKLGRLDCNLCHQAARKGSVELKRPAHEQCKLCHAAPFNSASGKEALCAVCHRSDGKSLLPFPARPDRVLGSFDHEKHTDPKGRLDPHSGFRADCTFCHAFAPSSLEPSRPGHKVCSSCHGKPGMPAQLTPFLRTAGCRGCHIPEEDPRPAPVRITAPVRFSHAIHLQAKRDTNLNCTSCHTGPANVDTAQCNACHSMMRPASHTARWQDDLHGKFAAMDRTACATCHSTDYCSRCHNELPRTHVPLPLFKNGGHARAAMLNERACFTCHTFQNTCGQCHTR